MKDKIKGVNLGGWLVLEKWMTPALFEGVESDDEYYLALDLPENEYKTRIKLHRDYFITEADFIRIAAIGINTVRIPVPYFIFGDRPPYIECVSYLDKAFKWAEKTGLKILIDLHTAPLSQNGFDNGGISGVCRWAQIPQEVEFVLEVLEKLSKRYGENQSLWGIQVLNEPATPIIWENMNPQKRYPPRDEKLASGSKAISLEFLFDFYEKAYIRMRQYLPLDKKVVFHDGFELEIWEDFFKNGNYENVVLDTHQYLMMAELTGTRQEVNEYVRFLLMLKDKIETVSKYVDVCVGEWSLFNSYAVGIDTNGGINPTAVNYEGNVKRTHNELVAIYQKLWEESVNSWNAGIGYFYWTYKLNIDTVNNPEWFGWDSWDFDRCFSQEWIKL
ncbi:cellulase family glycosylhydrolase [Aerococcaceae bacterium zg-ZUI334]|uniref:glycoside hydrolase family 5 protein n=1 Tax=Aerococcaceae bacterium zg-252 TaxID=2796928 RepID=UPI001B9ADDFB|nr:cellulase family glycosylhydrolase [Aerococcaceae bacterium zg-ZUI334]